MRALVALVVLASGCLRTTSFHCATDSECGAQGTCESVGFCSFADPACGSGRRFGDLAAGYANQCVGDQPGGDAANDGPHDAHVFNDAPPALFCDSTDPTLVGCWEFEGNLNDASGHNNNGVGTMVTFGAGKVGMAASIAIPNGHISAGDDASLAPTTLTIEAWVHPNSLPGLGARMGVIDNDGSWGLFIVPTGIECATTLMTTVPTTIPINTWTHLACTYDGATMHAYQDGAVIGTATGGTPLTTGSANGVAIASNSPSADNLDGLVDQLRVWSVPRTATQICIAAGRTGC